MCEMPRLSIRAVEGEERMQISFIFSPDTSIASPGSSSTSQARERVFNFDRIQTEELNKTLARISANVSKIVHKKKRKNKSTSDASGGSPEAEDVAVCLYREAAKVDDRLPNVQVWVDGAELHVGETRWAISVTVARRITCCKRATYDAGGLGQGV